MIVRTAAPQKPIAKRKKATKQLTFVDVRMAARGGDAAFEYYVDRGKLPVTK